jgi:Flp pilus assembly protein TadG
MSESALTSRDAVVRRRDRRARSRRASRRESGVAVAEFAIAFPFLLMLVLGICQISLMFVARSVVEYAAFCSARAELVGEDPERAAEFVCSGIAGMTYEEGTGDPIDVPGWGVLPRSEASAVKTSVDVIDPIDDGNGTVTVEVTHLYELTIPVASMMFKPISRPLEPGDVPDGLFVTQGGVPHFVLRVRYTRPVPWDEERQGVTGHPPIPEL